MVMERMPGTPISQVDELRAQGMDIPKLARAGVEIFFTQVFRDGFFHADMHPGNILVAPDGRYIALDFGIMGTLTDVDKNYLAQNFLAFFRRDYRRVAQAHIESGWAPPETRVDEFEAAIRAVCEPIFDRPLKEISFGRVLLRLFQTSRRFNMEIQPQLVMLQKTLLNIEGLGRQLDPDLDLWETAKPYPGTLDERAGGLARPAADHRDEAPQWARCCRSCRAWCIARCPIVPTTKGRPRSWRCCQASSATTGCWAWYLPHSSFVLILAIAPLVRLSQAPRNIPVIRGTFHVHLVVTFDLENSSPITGTPRICGALDFEPGA